MTIRGPGRVRHAGLALGIGILAFLATQLVAGRAANTAEVVVVLDANEVEWPYHDAVREAALGQLLSDPEARSIASNIAGPDATIDGELRSGQSLFSFEVDGTALTTTRQAADALMTWLMAENVAFQQAPFTQELATLAEKRADLQRRIDELEQGEDAASRSGSDELDTARYLENTSLLAQFERQADETQTQLDLIRPQFTPAAPANEVGRTWRPWMTGLAAMLAALAAFYLLEPAATPEPQDQ